MTNLLMLSSKLLSNPTLILLYRDNGLWWRIWGRDLGGKREKIVVHPLILFHSGVVGCIKSGVTVMKPELTCHKCRRANQKERQWTLWPCLHFQNDFILKIILKRLSSRNFFLTTRILFWHNTHFLQTPARASGISREPL